MVDKVSKKKNYIEDSDYAVAKLMTSIREVDNADAFLEAMIGMTITMLSKKHEMHIKNFIVLEDGAFCMNIGDTDTILTLRERIGEKK